MFWIRFRRTSPWAGSVFKVFFYNAPPADNVVPGNDGAIGSYTRPQLVAFVEAAQRALTQWPEQ